MSVRHGFMKLKQIGRYKANVDARSQFYRCLLAWKKAILLVDVSCPVEVNKKKKRRGNVRNIKSHVLSYEKDSLTITPAIGCIGGGMKNFKKDVKTLFKNKKELEKSSKKLRCSRAKQ